ncbi:MAG: hypothetical protein LAO20_21675 [Acidobacteriia bacterium]|nr:hypothetical protein [Terriglobia bacterium]
MAGTMIPVVYGKEAGGRKMPVVLLAHTGGSLIGGLIGGLVLGGLGNLMQRLVNGRMAAVNVFIGVVAFLLALRAARLTQLHLPESTWQVPRIWLVKMPEAMAAVFFGLCLGAGFLTRITNALYLVMGWVVLAGGIRWGITVMVIYALSRNFPLWALYLAAKGDQEKQGRYNSITQLWWPASFITSAVALAITGVFLITLGVK